MSAAPKNVFSGALVRGVILASIIVLFLDRASDTFTRNHAVGDQRQYLGLAMKLERSGFRDYSLRHISTIYPAGAAEYVYSEGDGNLLEEFRRDGIEQYDQPLYHTPPLFSYLLSVSRRIFFPGGGYEVLFPETAQALGLRERLNVQFYSSFVPLLSGFLLIVATFLIGRLLYDYWTAIIAMLLIAVSPVTLLSSEKLWPDATLAALVSLTVLFLLIYFRSKNPVYFGLSVVAYALAHLTKNTAILLIPMVVVTAVYFPLQRGEGLKSAVLAAARPLGIFFALVFVLTFPWYYTVYQTFGTPMFEPLKKGISKVHPYWRFLESMPWYQYLLSIPLMVPLFIAGYYRVTKVVVSKALSKDLLLVFWFLSFLLSLTIITAVRENNGPEGRYMLPAYPALAILAAVQLLRLKDWLATRLSAPVARAAIVASLVVCSIWSYRLSDQAYSEYPNVLNNPLNIPW